MARLNNVIPQIGKRRPGRPCAIMPTHNPTRCADPGRARMAESAFSKGTRWPYAIWSPTHKEWRPVYDAWIRDRFQKCVEEAGLPLTGEFHSRRRSFASHLLKAGAPITSVRDLLGHAELAMTNKYAHSVEDAREVIGRLEHLGRDAGPRKQENGESAEIQ